MELNGPYGASRYLLRYPTEAQIATDRSNSYLYPN